MAYVGSEQWQKQVDDATVAFKVTDSVVSPMRDVVYVNAEADTGSRYAVVVTRLPWAAAMREGGSLMVTVLQPWQTVYVVGDAGPYHADYIAEKFLRPGSKVDTVHGGDLAAIIKTVNYALGRLIA